MQTGTVSRLRFCRKSWGFKIHFWRNIVRCWKSYIYSNKLDVQETNCCFSQLNRIWNHLVGHWIEIGWFARSRTLGSNCFCSLEIFLVFQIDRGNMRVMITNVISLTRKSMWWETLILFFQMSNPRVKKLYYVNLRTMKLWSRWSLKAEVLQWDTSPEPTELLLIGWLIEIIWTPNQIHRHQKATHRHFNQREFHTWWVEPFVEFV